MHTNQPDGRANNKAVEILAAHTHANAHACDPAHPGAASWRLREVADVRKHSDQNQMSVQYQNVNKNPKGVLSLGLPPQMVPKGFTTMAKRPPQSAPSEAICHYYETLNPKYANVVSMQRQKV